MQRTLSSPEGPADEPVVGECGLKSRESSIIIPSARLNNGQDDRVRDVGLILSSGLAASTARGSRRDSPSPMSLTIDPRSAMEKIAEDFNAFGIKEDSGEVTSIERRKSGFANSGGHAGTFVDVAPVLFQRIRTQYGITPDEYLVSSRMLSLHSYRPKTGAFFFMSADSRFIFKTVAESEFLLLRELLPVYASYVFEYPQTLLPKLVGLYRIVDFRRKSHFVHAMCNVLENDSPLHYRFDLKGSTVNRSATEKELQDKHVTLKDSDFNERELKLHLGSERRTLFLAQVERDAAFLESQGIMDYSLLVGIHCGGGVLSSWGKSSGTAPLLGFEDASRGVETPRIVSALLAIAQVRKVACGPFHALGVCESGRVFAWGSGECGRLGLRNTESCRIPTCVPDITHAIDAAAGTFHSVVRTADGTVYTFGGGEKGQLGIGLSIESCSQPVMLAVSPAQHIAAGDECTVLVTRAGILACGANMNGELCCESTDTHVGQPTIVRGVDPADVVSLRCGARHTLCLARNHAVYSWGSNTYGQCGRGTTSETEKPGRIVHIEDRRITQVSAGAHHSVLLTDDGMILTCGANRHGQLGIGTRYDASKPIAVPLGVPVAAIAGSRSHSLALSGTGDVFGWGKGSYPSTDKVSPRDWVHPRTISRVTGAGSVYASYQTSFLVTKTPSTSASLSWAAPEGAYELSDDLWWRVRQTKANAVVFAYGSSPDWICDGTKKMMDFVCNVYATSESREVACARINIDRHPHWLVRYDIAVLPTLLLFKRGRLIDRITGVYDDMDELARDLDVRLLLCQNDAQWLRSSGLDNTEPKPIVSIFHKDGNALFAHGTDNDPTEYAGKRYFLGIIDITQLYNSVKRAEHFFKTIRNPAHRDSISAVETTQYKTRFVNYVSSITD